MVEVVFDLACDDLAHIVQVGEPVQAVTIFGLLAFQVSDTVVVSCSACQHPVAVIGACLVLDLALGGCASV